MPLYNQFFPAGLNPKDPEKLQGKSLFRYLTHHPDAKGNFHLRGLHPKLTAILLIKCPQFADQCDLSKISQGLAREIILAHPELLSRFDPAQLGLEIFLIAPALEIPAGFHFDLTGINRRCASSIVVQRPDQLNFFDREKLDWRLILRNRPELIEHLPYPLPKASWVAILCDQPGLFGFSPFREFRSAEWQQLIYHQPGLSEKCPWQKVRFSPKWRDNILLYRDLILKHRKDWKKHYYLDVGDDSSRIADLLVKAPHLEHLVNDLQRRIGKENEQASDRTCPPEEIKWNIFTPEQWIEILQSQPQLIKYCDVSIFDAAQWEMILQSQPQLIKYCDVSIFNAAQWEMILQSQPQLIKYCDVTKNFSNPPWMLLADQPCLADYFHLENSKIGDSQENDFRNFIRTQPELVPRVLKICREAEWEYLLPKHPEYLLQRDGSRFSFISSVRAFLLTKILDFNGTGLDGICNNVYNILEKKPKSPTGLFARIDISPAEFIINSVMDPDNAQCYLIGQLQRCNWSFIEELISDELETIHRMLNRKKISFFLCAAAPERTWRKYLDHCDDPASIRDKNGNTLLHAALMRAAFENIRSILEPDDGNPAFSLYVYLIGKGCDPEVKNKRGVSCRGLLSLLQNKVRSDLL